MRYAPETMSRIGIISNGSNVVDAGWASQLEEERNEARTQLEAWQTMYGSRQLSHAISERDQLRKVADELAAACDDFDPRKGYSSTQFTDALKAYNSLPHVIERNKSK